MQLMLIIVGVLVITIIASDRKMNGYCWFAYFLSFAAHVNLHYIYNYPNYIGKQNMGISVTLTEVLGLGLILSYILTKRKRESDIFKMFRRYSLYFLFSCCSLIYSYNIGMSINEIGIEVELLFVIYLVSFYFRPELFKYLKLAILVNSFLQTGLVLYQMETGINFRGGTLTYRYGVYRCQGLYLSPSELAIISLISFFFLLVLYLQNKRQKDRQILFIGMACNIVCIICGQSRTGFIILAIGLLLIVLINNKTMRVYSKRILRCVVLLSIVLIGIAFLTGKVDLGNSGDMLTSRVIMWLMGIKVFQEHPMIGVGNNAYTAFNSVFSTSHYRWEVTNPVHNIYLLELAETGIIGFTLLFLNFYFPLVKHAYKKLRGSVYYEALFIILFTQLVYSFTGWVFYSPSLRFFNMLIITILLKMGETDMIERQKTRKLEKDD